jgi:tRNA (cytidine32/guanosine34-2'-O)-methyltransferase
MEHTRQQRDSAVERRSLLEAGVTDRRRPSHMMRAPAGHLLSQSEGARISRYDGADTLHVRALLVWSPPLTASVRSRSLPRVPARSAFKLLQIARHFDIFSGVTRVVDLCAAPGGWTEVLSQQLVTNRAEEARPNANADATDATDDQSAAASPAYTVASSSLASAASSSSIAPGVTIVAVDLQAMSPLPGVHVIQGDLTRTATAVLIRSALGSEVDSSGVVHPALAELVVCDGAPDVIGMHDVDEAIQFELLLAALNITLHILRAGGAFVAKIFRGKDVRRMYALFRQHFATVTISKPKTCRNSSIEGFVVCQGFLGLSEERRKQGLEYRVTLEDATPSDMAVQFVSCWDDEGLDADMSYPLSYTFKDKPIVKDGANDETMQDAAASSSTRPSTYQNLTPSALPIDPPYKRSLQMKRQNMFQKQ